MSNNKKRSSKSSPSPKSPRKSTGKPLAIVLGGVVVAVILAVVLGQGGTEESAAVPAGSLADMPANHVRGAASASVTLAEFGDFQCPTCAAFHPVLQALLERFPDDLQIEFHHMPLVSIHPNAMPGALAAEAAGMQGKFWEMNDLLFENQSAWSTLRNPEAAFVAYAERLALDVDQFERDMRSDEVEARVLADARRATELGLMGTPSFFVNGRQIPLPSSYGDFERLIYDAIQTP